MRTIWKYEFDIDKLEMNKMIPAESDLLAVQVQNDSICAWFVVYPDNRLVNRKLQAYMTGGSLPVDCWNYVSTVQLDGFVLHIFDHGESEKKL